MLHHIRRASDKRNLTGIRVLNSKRAFLQKMNVSLIAHFCLIKHVFGINTFQRLMHRYTHTHTHTHIYIYIYIYIVEVYGFY